MERAGLDDLVILGLGLFTALLGVRVAALAAAALGTVRHWHACASLAPRWVLLFLAQRCVFSRARCWELARGWREVATTAFFVIFSVLASNYELWRPRLLHAQASVLQAASPPIVFTMGDKHLTPLVFTRITHGARRSVRPVLDRVGRDRVDLGGEGMQLVDLRLERVHGERQRVHEVFMHVLEILDRAVARPLCIELVGFPS